MPRIKLKENSPEFAEGKSKANTKACDMPGCRECGDFRAPKDRSLADHYWFCQDHITEYNKAWDFFSGMPASEVEKHILNSIYGDRPTRRYDVNGAAAEALRARVWQTYHFTDQEPPKSFERDGSVHKVPQTPEHQAMELMGLEAPLDLKKIKARYKELAKKHHPDLNKGDKKAEELLKEINMAYTILKLAFAKYEKLAVS